MKTREELIKESEQKIWVHGAMTYQCDCCGDMWRMFLEKGIEEFGENHKPSPFIIQCRCGGRAKDISGICSFAGEEKYNLLPPGEGYFANREDCDCGVPVLPLEREWAE